MKPADAKPLRIVFLSFDYWPPDFGGELLISIERLQTLVERGHSVVVLTHRPLGSGRAERHGALSIRRCPVGGRSLAARAAYLLWAASALLCMSFDAIHLGVMPASRAPTGALAAWLFASIAKARGARTVSVVSLADSEMEAWHVSGRTRLFRWLYYHRVDRIVAVSPALFEPLYQWRLGKAVLITCGVRDDLFTPLSSEERRLARKQLGIPEDGVVFMTIGAVIQRKGYDLLAQAFAALNPKHGNWFLWMVGPMPHGCTADQWELVELLAPLRQYKSQVRCFGRIDDRGELRRLLGASDVFVFPTRREGFGLAPVEAMAMALPVIVARIPGVTDVAPVDQETGLFVPVGDVEALVQAMERLGNDSGLRATLGSKARQRIAKEFSWESHIARWEKLYSQGVA